MTLLDFIDNLDNTQQAPQGVSPIRWRAMQTWLKKRQELSEPICFDTDLLARSYKIKFDWATQNRTREELLADLDKVFGGGEA